MKTTIRVLLSAALVLFPMLANARHHHGSCDGIHGCRCGTTAARINGLPLDYRGLNLKQASQWKRLPHTSPRAGAVFYRHGLGPTGHVSTVVSYAGGCGYGSLTVRDETGEHQDNACASGATFVDPRG
jgi:hypothetical protein